MTEPVAGQVVDIDVSEEMETSFLEYAYSVIYSRALPDARDGLKPVQRRIIYQMGEMGLRPDRPHVKSSRIVGDVMGKLHPHSDVAIYDALVRLSQDFVMRTPLVDGHGNFGSLDDGPAAPRYTEARLTDAALTMIAGLDEDVVDFVPNYDSSTTQPEVLPSAFPNLLVNGASGIAVGMATNMAPHNPGEVIAAAQHLIDNPEAELSELMKYVPGPDLPSGGRIIGLSGVREAYETGRGSFRTRATVKIENITARRKGIIVTELPYLVGPEKVIEKVKDVVGNKKLAGIASIDDFSDRKHGLRLVIGIKNGFNPDAVLEELYRLTPLEDSFGINNVCLVDGQPRTLGLKALLEVYVDHRIDVTRRRTVFQLGKAKDRLHLVEGLLTAILDIDEVIELIRSSDDAQIARTRLMSVFDLSEVQATYILDLQLRRLTKFSRLELEAEQDELKKRIDYLQSILDDEAKLRQVVSEELGEVADQIDSPRRTVLVEGSHKQITARGRKKGSPELQVADSPTWVLLSTSGRIARTADRSALPTGGKRLAHDALVSQVASTTRGIIGAITSKGRLLTVDVVALSALPPQATRPGLAGGVKVGEFVTLDSGEKVLGLIDITKDFVLATASGVIKRVAGAEPAKGKDAWDVINLKSGDTVIGAGQLPDIDAARAVLITSNAQLLTFGTDLLRAQGWNAGGVTGMKVAADASVIAFSLVDPAAENRVVTIATGENFYGETALSVKVTDLTEFPPKGRATAGVRAHRFLKGETELVTAFAGPEPQGAATGGGARKLPAELGRRDGSGQPLESKVDAIGTVPHAYGAEAGSAAPEAEGSGETASGGLSAEELARRKEEIAQSRDDDDSPAVIVSAEDDEDSGGALF
ncbi:DNA gyrase/topoisomerase IV subunit A [Brevibacterium luteolum]|uniref:DNA gyrase/topoisomerase IV subunit A n=1 Tax=Brevibacterium luteolum TaxID=199591 RepID=UPI00223AD607|nr:DNA topoisomerase IV subunit A [Brevibacterium luteolum]MCT1872607.1 DNA topoisomerase IV subunit A [Brevibacterium luteolum]MCT1890580.1 DNA topoisomerase IV subunit A [Brevibacterium luteolum]MCT1893070.1 DNA topoisomerase IV subunit A [Brevibacterium luteolum]MCT1923862.1 DNA topoisomerase IV subunit A [Brevibacterium luteolum]